MAKKEILAIDFCSLSNEMMRKSKSAETETGKTPGKIPDALPGVVFCVVSLNKIINLYYDFIRPRNFTSKILVVEKFPKPKKINRLGRRNFSPKNLSLSLLSLKVYFD